MKFPSNIFYLAADVPGVERSWSLGHEGMAPGWAFLLFLLSASLTVFAYLRFAPGVGKGRRIAMMSLRLVSSTVLLVLLTKPVLRFTENKVVKQPLAVLVDNSRSMKTEDRRETPADRARAAIVSGAVDADHDLSKGVSASIAAQVKDFTRQDLLRRLKYNQKLDLWGRLGKNSDLVFYGFGADAKPVPVPATESTGKNTPVDFPELEPTEPVTAIGEALRQVLQEPRGQTLGGVLLITDGNSNQGSSPLEAAQIAREQNVPLFIYGIGVTSPPDIEVRETIVQSLAFAGERVEVRARIVSHGIDEKPATVTLKADGQNVAQVEATLGGDKEQEIAFRYVPAKAGDVKLEVSVPARDEEAAGTNNAASTTVQVTDQKFNVLLIEQEPRWDFRYLLDYLQRDPRLMVKCVMIDGEPGLPQLPGSPFLPSLPDSRADLFAAQVLILGDVSPSSLGQARMEMIAEWVEAGGGIIFLAGSKSNPSAYLNTPLERLLPVVPDRAAAASRREPKPFPLELTASGRRSPYLQMDSDPEANTKMWDNFPGVRWVAPVTRLRAGAEALLVDPRPASSGRYGMLPVVAMQGFGSGKCVYFGTNETYRWRSKKGEQYYSILWGQIMQTLALQLLDTASSLTQLRTDRKHYQVGDRVVISGNVYAENFEPVVEPSLEGVLTITGKDSGKPGITRPQAVLGTSRNAYRGEFVAKEPGHYVFHTVRDKEGVLTFEVEENNLEDTRTSLDDRLLKSMATAAGGKFLREEDLARLPEWISASASRVAYRKLELYHSGWVMAGLMLLWFAEWLLRRLSRLK
ncbi:MAG: VWA domain-containing protein [Verrucomicrobiota bacterium]